MWLDSQGGIVMQHAHLRKLSSEVLHFWEERRNYFPHFRQLGVAPSPSANFSWFGLFKHFGF